MTSYVGNNHSIYPYSSVVYIEATFPNGESYLGSGAVVGENDVLTASHVVYSSTRGGLAEDIDVYPGRDGSDSPFGSYDADSANYFLVDQDGDDKVTAEESEDDVAILGFDSAFGNETDWFGLDPHGIPGNYNLTGYPGLYADSTGPRMTNDFGYVTASANPDVYYYTGIESNPGNSGGPLWHSGDTRSMIVGVASTYGWASDINSHYSEILGWIDDNDYLLNEGDGQSITFSDPASSSSTFEDLFTDPQSSSVEWYRLWTGNAAGDQGSFVDTSTFNRYGQGWITKESLDQLDIDFAQYGDNYLWLQPYNSTDGYGDWVKGQVDFSAASQDDVTTTISSNITMDKMFSNKDEASGTWYRLWIGDSDGDTGSFLATGSFNNASPGWIEADDLDQLNFSASDAGNDLWVKTWTPEAEYGWEHWRVGSSQDQNKMDVAIEAAISANEVDLTGVTSEDSQNLYFNL